MIPLFILLLFVALTLRVVVSYYFRHFDDQVQYIIPIGIQYRNYADYLQKRNP